MPVGVPAKEQLRADIDKIIRRAAKGLPPKKRGVAHIIQWETLPQLPQERTKNTGPIWSVPKSVQRLALEYEYIPEPPLPKPVKPPPSPPPAKKKKSPVKRTKAPSAPPPEMPRHLPGDLDFVSLSKLKMHSNHLRSFRRRQPPPEEETFLPLARTDESRKQVENYFRRIADPALVENWLQSFDKAQDEISKREARQLAKQVEADWRKRLLQAKQSKFIGVAKQEDGPTRVASTGSDGEDALAQVAEELTQLPPIARRASLVGGVGRRGSIGRSVSVERKKPGINWQSLKRFLRLKPQLEEFRQSEIAKKHLNLGDLDSKLDSEDLRKASLQFSSGVVHANFERLRSQIS